MAAKFPLVAVAATALALSPALTGVALAAPGAPVYYGTGPLLITNDPSAGGMYANPTYLKSKSLTPDVFLFNRGTSEVVTLAAPTLATLGYASLDELIFTSTVMMADSIQAIPAATAMASPTPTSQAHPSPTRFPLKISSMVAI